MSGETRIIAIPRTQSQPGVGRPGAESLPPYLDEELAEQRVKPARGAIYGLLLGGGMWTAILLGVLALKR
jgi:hypothetical protein